MAALFALLAGCDSSSPTSTEPGPDQPAKTLTPGATWKGSVDPDDTLRLSFHADSGHTYGLTLKFVTDSGWVNFQVFDGAVMPEHHHYYAGYGITGYTDSIAFPANRTGTFTILVFAHQAKQARAIEVGVSESDGFPADFAEPDPYEEDGDRKSAKLLPSDGTVQRRTLHGFDGWGGDRDMIAVQVDSGKTYTLRYESVPSKALVSVVLQNASYWSEPVYQETVVDGKEVRTIVCPAEKKETIYIQISNGEHAQRYTVSATVQQGLPERMLPDRYESDNTMASATPIGTDSVVQRHSIHDQSLESKDVDWISFHADSGYTYYVTYTFSSKYGGFWGTIFSPDSMPRSSAVQSIGRMGEWQGHRATLWARKSGTYHVHFAGGSERLSYDVAVSRNPVPGIPREAIADVYEDDNTLAGAKPISADSTWQDRMLHGWQSSDENDVDLVSFQGEAGTTYRLYWLDSTNFMEAAILASDSSTIASVEAYTSTRYVRTTTFTIPASGTYYIRLSTTFIACPYRVALVAVKPES